MSLVRLGGAVCLMQVLACHGGPSPSAPPSTPAARRGAPTVTTSATPNDALVVQYRGDRERTGRVRRLPGRPPRLAWCQNLTRAATAPPAIVGDDLVLGTLDGTLARLDAQGRVRWSRRLGGPIHAAPVVAAGRIYAGADDGLLHAFWLDGREAWRFALGPCAAAEAARLAGAPPGPEARQCDADSAPVVGGDGMLYFGGDAAYALQPSGTRPALRWRMPLSRHARAAAVLAADGTLYFGAQDNALHALTRDGRRRWSFRRLYHFDATPSLDSKRHTIYAPCEDGTLYAVDAATGNLRWQQRTGTALRHAAALGYDGTVYLPGSDGHLRALSPTGVLRWRYVDDAAFSSDALVDETGLVVVGTRGGLLAVREGRLVWRVDLSAAVYAVSASSAHGLAVTTTDARICAFR